VLHPKSILYAESRQAERKLQELKKVDATMSGNSAEFKKKRDHARQAIGRAVCGSFHRPNNDRLAVEKQHGALWKESGETKPSRYQIE
jgi:hypothetical protein